MRIIEAKQIEFEYDGQKVIVYSHESLREPEKILVTLFGPGYEMTVEAGSTGEGMVLLADYIKGLGYRLAQEAFVQEGAVRLTEKS
jgi:hypothetical protein